MKDGEYESTEHTHTHTHRNYSNLELVSIKLINLLTLVALISIESGDKAYRDQCMKNSKIKIKTNPKWTQE